MQRSFCYALVIVSIWLPIFATAERQPLAIIEITSCNAFSGDVNTMAQAINLPFIAMGVNGWLSQITSCPNLTGVDVNKPLRLYVLPSETENRPPVTAAVLPLLDQGEIMLGALRGAFNNQDNTAIKDGEIIAFTGAKPGSVRNDVFVVPLGKRAVMGSNRAAVAEIAAALKNDALPDIASVSGTLRATLDIATLVPLLEKQLKHQAATMRTITPTSPGQPNPGEIMELQQSALLTVMRQLQSFSVGLSAEASGLTLYTRIDPLTNSIAAQVFALRRPPDQRYRALLPPRAFFALAGTGLDAMDLLAEPYAAFTDKLYARMDAPFAKMGPLVRSSLTDAKGIYKGDFAFAVSSSTNGKGLEFVEYIAVKDEQTAIRSLRTSMTNTMALWGSNTNAGFFSLKTDAPRKSGKIEVWPFRYTFNPQAMPAPAMPFLSWFGDLYCESAVAQGHIIMVMSGSNTVTHAMDRALAGLTTPVVNAAAAPQICTLFPEIKTVPVTEWRLASSDLLRLILTATGQADAKKIALLPPPGDGIGGIELRRGDALFSALRISFSELTALSKAFMMLNQTRMPKDAAGRSTIPPHMSAEPAGP